MQRPKIDYPCEWIYKVIGKDQESIEEAIKEALPHPGYQVSFSRKSSTGKYTCLNLKALVKNQEERDTIYKDLSNNPNIIRIL